METLDRNETKIQTDRYPPIPSSSRSFRVVYKPNGYETCPIPYRVLDRASSDIPWPRA